MDWEFFSFNGYVRVGYNSLLYYFVGLPFFVSATAWYCKLCNQWMGDLHCASAHLKSDIHEAKFTVGWSKNLNSVGVWVKDYRFVT